MDADLVHPACESQRGIRPGGSYIPQREQVRAVRERNRSACENRYTIDPCLGTCLGTGHGDVTPADRKVGGRNRIFLLDNVSNRTIVEIEVFVLETQVVVIIGIPLRDQSIPLISIKSSIVRRHFDEQFNRPRVADQGQIGRVQSGKIVAVEDTGSTNDAGSELCGRAR